MLKINDKHLFDWTPSEFIQKYNINPSCLCSLDIKEISQCQADLQPSLNVLS